MKDNVVNIHPPTIAENIVTSLKKHEDTTEELYVLRAYINEDGERALEWYTTACESRVWSVGALYYLAHKIMDGGGGYWEPDEEGIA